MLSLSYYLTSICLRPLANIGPRSPHTLSLGYCLALPSSWLLPWLLPLIWFLDQMYQLCSDWRVGVDQLSALSPFSLSWQPDILRLTPLAVGISHILSGLGELHCKAIFPGVERVVCNLADCWLKSLHWQIVTSLIIMMVAASSSLPGCCRRSLSHHHLLAHVGDDTFFSNVLPPLPFYYICWIGTELDAKDIRLDS